MDSEGGEGTEKNDEAGKPKVLSEEARVEVEHFMGRLGELLGADVTKLLAGHLPTLDTKGAGDKQDPEETENKCWQDLRAARAKEATAKRNKHKADKNVERLKEQLAKAEERATSTDKTLEEAEQQLENTRAKYLARVSPDLREQHEREAGFAGGDGDYEMDDAELKNEQEELDKERAAWLEKRKAIDAKVADHKEAKRRKQGAGAAGEPRQEEQAAGAPAFGPQSQASGSTPPGVPGSGIHDG